MYFAMVCLARGSSGNDLFVTDEHGRVTATTEGSNGFTSDQLRLALYLPNSGGVCLKNKGTGNLLAVPSGNNAALLTADSVDIETKLEDPSAVLQIVGGDNGYMVIRGLQEPNNNLISEATALTTVATSFFSGHGKTTIIINGPSDQSESELYLGGRRPGPGVPGPRH